MLLFIAALILAAPFAVGWLLRKRNRNTGFAETLWPLVERQAHVLLEDKRLNPTVGDCVEMVVRHLGGGKFARIALRAALHKAKTVRPEEDLRAAVATLNPQQHETFLRFIVTALYFDSHNSLIAGTIVRRWLYWLADTAQDKSAPISDYEVEPVVYAMDRHCIAA